MKTLWMVPVLMIVGASFLFCQQEITIRGSDTMVILSQRWAEQYMARHKDVTILVLGGGSETGISALLNGTTDICNASRPMSAEERNKMQEGFGRPVTEIPCALDGLSIYVNRNNPVTELSLDQVRQMYEGTITSWSLVGGEDQPVELYGRENSSGTYSYFIEHVLAGGSFDSSVRTMAGTAAIVDAVGKHRGAIGYGGAAYGTGIRELRIRANDTSAAYAPTPDNIASGNYPISRKLYMYVVGAPEGSIKDFIDWTLSDEGQKVVSDVGYFPLR